METKLFKIFVSLGIPGLSLGIFYLLFKSFNWSFPTVPINWAGPIIMLFMFLTSWIVFYTLTLWKPKEKIISYTVIDKDAFYSAAALEKILEQIGTVLDQRSIILELQKNQGVYMVEQRRFIDNAITAVQRAINHTRHYIAGRRAGDRDRNIERELSDKGLEVGDRLREIDSDEAQYLYTICFLKARFWSDTYGWNESDTYGRNISLDSVSRCAERMRYLAKKVREADEKNVWLISFVIPSYSPTPPEHSLAQNSILRLRFPPTHISLSDLPA